MPFIVELFTATSCVAPHPSVELTVPSDFKIIGGGAFDNWKGYGNLLTACYPKGTQTWFAAGKDHEESDPSSITAYAFALYDPHNDWIVYVQPSDPKPGDSHNITTARLPKDYLVTGGGAWVDYKGAGNMLTASYPHFDTATERYNIWEARSKDHDVVDRAQIWAYAIGVIPPFGMNIDVQVFPSVPVKSPGGQPASAKACLPDDQEWVLIGGGAFDDWESVGGDGNLLTASYPDLSGDPSHPQCWRALGKDQKHPSGTTIQAYAIGMREKK
jgi:hypothetical protein